MQLPIADNQIVQHWPTVHNQVRARGPERGRNLKVEYLGEFESISKIALNRESGDQLGTFGEITWLKKSHATVYF